ncbi:MAG: TIGR01777 family oxidoreductase [Sulfurimonas sp.]|nr:TIGR01777 family oxidoreductase [Sulfurimonas sp.]MDD3060094.1 TIGR01777 family oxidoreductase [Sulfurimonas sp.]MDD5203338.1 TIGR01777 family oxidoreductase [Sulfurimonas sp.]
MKVAITGVSGFVGSNITKLYTDFVAIHRNDTEDEILSKLEGVEVVINLAGAPIIKKWSEAYKKVLKSSRVDTTRTLVNAINRSQVHYFISTSAIGAYPDGMACDERFEGYGDDFLASLTKEWEAEAHRCTRPTAILRFGVILGSEGGALAQMLTPFRLGLGGNIGDGKMMMSWIDVDDLMGIYQYLIEHKLTGIFNATAPYPLTNAAFTKALGKALHRPTFFPLPVFVLKLLFGEGSSVLTGSKEVYPKAITDAGYVFKYKDIDASLAHLLG